MELDHSSASLAVVPPNAGVLQNETDVCQPQEEWNVAASFADEEPASCISALEFRRAVSSAGSVYCEQIRALRIPPEFPGFAVDQKVGYVADCLQAMSEACRDEFLRIHHRADEQDRSIQIFSTCLQNGDSAMLAENEDLQRLNALEDSVNDELPYTCHISSYACVGCAPAFCVLSVARLRLLSCPSRLRLLHVRFSIARPASMAFLPLLARVRT